MADQALHRLTIGQAGQLLRQRAISSTELTQAALDRIDLMDGTCHAFLTVSADVALAGARRADAAFASGEDLGPMQGIPYALKDIIDTAGIRTTANSRLLLHNIPDRDADVAARLRQAGGVLLGKLATYEFALDGPSFDLPFPAPHNPHNLAHITGGSSSGSAAAVAGGLVRMAVGTDTGGSIRSPAGYCGIVGLKPTFGRVSMQGIHPLSPSLDHAGPMALTVAEAALAFDVIAGADPRHPVRPASAQSRIGQHIGGLRLGYARSFHARARETSAEVLAALDDAASQFSLLGAKVEEIELPDYALFEACGTTILQAEAFAVHRENLRNRGGEFGRFAWLGLHAGAALAPEAAEAAVQMRHSLTARLNEEVFGRFDAVLCANTLTGAPRFEEFDGITPRWTPMRTLPFNVTGHPALALPMGVGASNLPLSLQIVGRAFDEAGICQIGAAFENSTHWGGLAA